MNEHFVHGFYRVVTPIGDLLEQSRVHPHLVTAAGFMFSVITGILFWRGQFFWGGVAFVVSGACDVLDGRLARSTRTLSSWGAILDSTLDRYSEIAVYIGLAAYFDSPYIRAVVILAMAGSLMTSYLRARAEGLGVDCKVGLMQRPERITFISVGAILGALFDLIFGTHQALLTVALFGVAILANFTVIERIVHVRKELRSE